MIRRFRWKLRMIPCDHHYCRTTAVTIIIPKSGFANDERPDSPDSWTAMLPFINHMDGGESNVCLEDINAISFLDSGTIGLLETGFIDWPINELSC